MGGAMGYLDMWPGWLAMEDRAQHAFAHMGTSRHVNFLTPQLTPGGVISTSVSAYHMYMSEIYLANASVVSAGSLCLLQRRVASRD
jgi:hypothetical protein